MDDDKKQELPRRAVACKGFEWQEGMREEHGAICCRVLGGVPWYWFVDGDTVTEHEGEECFPDLGDPATLGCLLALVREAWAGRRLGCLNLGKGWRVGDGLGWTGPVADSEAEALVAALEAAP